MLWLRGCCLGLRRCARASLRAVHSPQVLGHPVCKGKYQPWRGGERQYGCFRHHALRKRKVEKFGLRTLWESFEQWPPPPPPPPPQPPLPPSDGGGR